MNKMELDKKLTPAAQQALDELVNDYRNKILLGAQESARSLSGELQEISLHDILAGVNRNQPKRATSYPRTLEFALQLYSIIGLLMGVGGIFYAMFNNFSAYLGSEERIGMMIGVSGLLLSLLSFALLKLRQTRAILSADTKNTISSQDTGYAIAFVTKWQEVELAIRNSFASRLGESSAKEPISILISSLKQEAILSDDETKRIKELLDIRNRVLHIGLELNQEQFERANRDAEKILMKLRAS